MPSPYELQRNVLNFFFVFCTDGHFVWHSRIMEGNHNGAFRRKYALLVPFGGTNRTLRRKMVGEGFEAVDK